MAVDVRKPGFAGTRKAGEIIADAIYTLDEVDARLGLGKSALRTARRQGLTVKRIGRRGYVLGRDVIEWFERSAKTT
jgi:hypothetical protein